MSKAHKDSFDDEKLPEGIVLKEHSYDGIREYDQRLPRWWLITLYGAIIFSGLYWLVTHYYDESKSSIEIIEARLSDIAAIRLANSIDVTNNALFWEMSENPQFVQAGKETYDSICVTCHGPDLKGGIGFNLVDGEWIHGAQPSNIYKTIYDGILDKGMPAQGTQLGQKRISEVVAYVLSKNDRSVMQAAAGSISESEQAQEDTQTVKQTEIDLTKVDTEKVKDTANTSLSGQEAFNAYCQACHGVDLKGITATSLMDGDWKHGSTPDAIRKSISEGIPGTTMIAWGKLLDKKTINELTIYILDKNKQAKE